MADSIDWDDPEQYPEDEEDGSAPGDPPQQLEGGALAVVHESLSWERRLNPDTRERRLRRIDDHLATREYRERRKAELRREHGGRFA